MCFAAALGITAGCFGRGIKRSLGEHHVGSSREWRPMRASVAAEDVGTRETKRTRAGHAPRNHARMHPCRNRTRTHRGRERAPSQAGDTREHGARATATYFQKVVEKTRVGTGRNFPSCSGTPHRAGVGAWLWDRTGLRSPCGNRRGRHSTPCPPPPRDLDEASPAWSAPRWRALTSAT